MERTEEERFAAWAKLISDPRTGIPLPTVEELEQVKKRPCRYLAHIQDDQGA